MVLLRFRAWDSWRKRMSIVDRIYIDTKGVRLYDDFGEYWRDFSEIELMQSTGLFDKNGQEIFEGDILTDGHTPGILRNHQALGFYMVDEKEKERFLSDTVDTEGFEEAKEFMGNSIEIIGNVYQNPELLEVDND